MHFNPSHFLESLDLQIDQRKLLKHPFYIAWTEGKLTKDCLKEYALQYYHHVKAFPTYLSALHAHTDDMETRKEILKNLWEEEAGSPNHPDLWRDFAETLGATDQEIKCHEANPEMLELIRTFKEICSNGSVAEGIAALYAYESQIPEICHSKIEGLKKFYGFSHPRDWSYFNVHAVADIEHSSVERELLSRHMNTHLVSIVQLQTQKVLEALWGFLTSLCHRYQIAC